MRTIILTKGIPASGKSTWAEEEMKKHPNKYKRINKDLFREMLDCNKWSEKNETFLLRMRNIIVESSLVKGYDVIIDDTNFNNIHWESMCEIAKQIGNVQVIEKYFDITLKEALERNSKRLRVVPDNVIEKMYYKYIKNTTIEEKKEYYPKNKIGNIKTDKNKKYGVIVDIDGTIALPEHRSVFDHKQVITDEPYSEIINLIDMLDSKYYYIILITGRSDSCKEDTIKWLDNNYINYHELHMRKDGDNRKDTIIKEEIYLNHIVPNYNIIYAIDDRPQVCRMWRKHNINVLQLNHIDF